MTAYFHIFLLLRYYSYVYQPPFKVHHFSGFQYIHTHCHHHYLILGHLQSLSTPSPPHPGCHSSVSASMYLPVLDISYDGTT